MSAGGFQSQFYISIGEPADVITCASAHVIIFRIIFQQFPGEQVLKIETFIEISNLLNLEEKKRGDREPRFAIISFPGCKRKRRCLAREASHCLRGPPGGPPNRAAPAHFQRCAPPSWRQGAPPRPPLHHPAHPRPPISEEEVYEAFGVRITGFLLRSFLFRKLSFSIGKRPLSSAEKGYVELLRPEIP